MSTASFTTYYQSPVGWLCLTGTAQSINSLIFCETPGQADAILPAPLQQCLLQLQEYFEGTRQAFELPLQPLGTHFQQQVWENLKLIPFGKTCSYLDIARQTPTGEKAIRAVGAANGKNPLCIVVPCHRVIGSDGSLTGYAGGLWRKEWLLRHEGALQAERQLQLF